MRDQDRSEDAPTPLISVIMANYQGGRYIAQALGSVLRQTVRNIEVLVSDDASEDDSLAQVAAVQVRDPRVRLIASDRNGGPARCRNRALDDARGDWIAIVDSDDMIHPERFERLLAAADQARSDIVADDLLYFHEDGSPTRFLLPEDQRTPLEVTPRDWIVAGQRGTPPLGYLKPMIRRSALGMLRYDETLRIGEDYDLMLRLLLSGARLFVVPEPWYFYRRHGTSISRRLSVHDIEAMLKSQARFLAEAGTFDPATSGAFTLRRERLEQARHFELLVAALKRRDLAAALPILLQRPAVLPRLVSAGREHFARSAIEPRETATPRQVFLSEEEAGTPEGGLTIRVPAYDLPQAPRWGGMDRRSTWRRIADLGRGAAAVAFDSPAGAYAAGFIPGAVFDPIGEGGGK